MKKQETTEKASGGWKIVGTDKDGEPIFTNSNAVLETETGERIPLAGTKIRLELKDGTIQEIDASQMGFSLSFDTRREIVNDKLRTKRPRKTPVIFPDNIISPKSLASQEIFCNYIDTNATFPITTVPATKKKKEKYGAVVKLDYNAIEQDRCVRIDGELDPYKRLVHDAVNSLKHVGNSIFSTEDLNRVMKCDPNAKLTDVEMVEIAEAMNAMGRFDVMIITDPAGVEAEIRQVWDKEHGKLKPERKIYPALASVYKDKLLSFAATGYKPVEVMRTIDGKRNKVKTSVPTIWIMKNLPGEENTMPILYQYAQAKGQIATTPMRELNPTAFKALPKPINRTRRTDTLDSYLRQRIETMKNNPEKDKLITNQKLYELDGVENVADSAVKNKKAHTRKKVKKLLDGYKESGYIVGYVEETKKMGRVIQSHGFRIVDTKDSKKKAKSK